MYITWNKKSARKS